MARSLTVLIIFSFEKNGKVERPKKIECRFTITFWNSKRQQKSIIFLRLLIQLFTWTRGIVLKSFTFSRYHRTVHFCLFIRYKFITDLYKFITDLSFQWVSSRMRRWTRHIICCCTVVWSRDRNQVFGELSRNPNVWYPDAKMIIPEDCALSWMSLVILSFTLTTSCQQATYSRWLPRSDFLRGDSRTDMLISRHWVVLSRSNFCHHRNQKFLKLLRLWTNHTI